MKSVLDLWSSTEHVKHSLLSQHQCQLVLDVFVVDETNLNCRYQLPLATHCFLLSIQIGTSGITGFLLIVYPWDYKVSWTPRHVDQVLWDVGG